MLSIYHFDQTGFFLFWDCDVFSEGCFGNPFGSYLLRTEILGERQSTSGNWMQRLVPRRKFVLNFDVWSIVNQAQATRVHDTTNKYDPGLQRCCKETSHKALVCTAVGITASLIVFHLNILNIWPGSDFHTNIYCSVYMT